MWTAGLTGFVLGFLGSMPIAGPVSILVFGHGVAGRRSAGLYLALGAASAESGYACLAFWGFSEFLVHYAWIEPVSRALSALILVALGLRLALGHTSFGRVVEAPERRFGVRGNALLGLTIAALNPALIANWGAVVSMAYASGSLHFVPAAAVPFAAGAWCGIVSWFSILLALLGKYKQRISEHTISSGLRVMGVLVALLGLGLAGRFVLWLVRSS